jgi:hypothetical protein
MNSDQLSELPITSIKAPEHYARLKPYVPLMDSGQSSKEIYLVLGGIFLVLSLPLFDALLFKLVPSLEHSKYVFAVVKTALFLLVLLALNRVFLPR